MTSLGEGGNEILVSIEGYNFFTIQMTVRFWEGRFSTDLVS